MPKLDLKSEIAFTQTFLFLTVCFTFWKFHSFAATSLHLILGLPIHLPLNVMSFVIINNPVSPLSAAHVLMGIWPSTGAQTTYKCSHPPKETDSIFLLWQPSTGTMSSHRSSSLRIPSLPCWNFDFLDLVYVFWVLSQMWRHAANSHVLSINIDFYLSSRLHVYLLSSFFEVPSALDGGRLLQITHHSWVLRS